jgi:hypothetical protein
MDMTTHRDIRMHDGTRYDRIDGRIGIYEFGYKFLDLQSNPGRSYTVYRNPTLPENSPETPYLSPYISYESASDPPLMH